MNKIVYEFLKELKFDDGEIKTLVSINPVLEELSVSEVEESLNAVISFGYPVEDITHLIAQNPGFLSRNVSDLVLDLKNIALLGDVEELLKNDPFLI